MTAVNDQLIIDRVKQAERERVLRLMAEALRRDYRIGHGDACDGGACEACEHSRTALAAFDALGLEEAK